jgi:hypothetical protein
MPKESVLSHAEKSSFVIEHFIFHIIRTDSEHPIYLETAELLPEQRSFFQARFSDVAEGVQHVFVDPENSTFFHDCTTMLADPKANFLPISKRLASSFQKLHSGNMIDGAFVIAIVSAGERKFIFLLKIDNTKVIHYDVKDAKALLKLIENTFVEDKKAIQKSALIDITGTSSWQVLATDRSGSAHKALTTFFASYLTVTEKENASTLTPLVVKSVTNWAINNKATLGLKEDVATYKNKAINYLKVAAQFNTGDLIDALFRDETDNVTELRRYKTNLKTHFDQDGLSGQSFVPNQGSLTLKVRKNVRVTAEGVKIEWDGDMKANNVSISDNRDEQGYYTITIKTNSYLISDK